MKTVPFLLTVALVLAIFPAASAVQSEEPPFYAYTHPAWGPGPGKILADSGRYGRRAAMIDLETLEISAYPGAAGHPDWSKAADRIVFETYADGRADLFLLDPRQPEAEPDRLTNSPGFDQFARWSRDGRWITFTSTRHDNLELYVIASDGSRERRLTEDAGADFGGSFSPDGKELVFQSNRSGHYQLYRISIEGGEPLQLTRGDGDSWFADWGQDGRIYFTSNRDGDNEICSMLPDGSDFRFHTRNRANDVLPRLSPDGSALVFQSDLEWGTDIYLLTLADDALRRVTRGRHFVNLIRSRGVGEARKVFDSHRNESSKRWLFYRQGIRAYVDHLAAQARLPEAIAVQEMLVDHYPNAAPEQEFLEELRGRLGGRQSSSNSK